MEKRSNKKTFQSLYFFGLFFKVFCKLYAFIIKETNVLTATIKEGTLYIYKFALNILLLHIFFDCLSVFP